MQEARRRRRTKWAALIAALAVVAAACSGGGATVSDRADDAQSPVAAARSGEPAPTTEFAMFDGTTATFANYAGRPLVVNFWASWCPSCVAEMSAAFKPVQEQLGDQVAFLGLNITDERARALELVDETGVLFDLAEDPAGEVYLELGGLGMPFTVFISPEGEVLEEHNGPLTADQLRDVIDEVLLG